MSSALLNPTECESKLALIGPRASPTPKQLLKYPAEILFSIPPFKCGRASSIECYISGYIGTINIQELKPRRQRPINITFVLSGIIKIGLVPIIKTLRQKMSAPTSNTALLEKTLQYSETSYEFRM